MVWNPLDSLLRQRRREVVDGNTSQRSLRFFEPHNTRVQPGELPASVYDAFAKGKDPILAARVTFGTEEIRKYAQQDWLARNEGFVGDAAKHLRVAEDAVYNHMGYYSPNSWQHRLRWGAKNALEELQWQVTRHIPDGLPEFVDSSFNRVGLAEFTKATGIPRFKVALAYITALNGFLGRRMIFAPVASYSARNAFNMEWGKAPEMFESASTFKYGSRTYDMGRYAYEKAKDWLLHADSYDDTLLKTTGEHPERAGTFRVKRAGRGKYRIVDFEPEVTVSAAIERDFWVSTSSAHKLGLNHIEMHSHPPSSEAAPSFADKIAAIFSPHPSIVMHPTTDTMAMYRFGNGVKTSVAASDAVAHGLRTAASPGMNTISKLHGTAVSVVNLIVSAGRESAALRQASSALRQGEARAAKQFARAETEQLSQDLQQLAAHGDPHAIQQRLQKLRNAKRRHL